MQIIYRNQLPGKEPKESRFEGWLAALIGVAVLIGAIALVILFIPILLFGFLAFIRS